MQRRRRKQDGSIVRDRNTWFLRYWEWRNVDGTLQRKRVTHTLGPVETRGKNPPADIKVQAERKMAAVNTGSIPADRITTLGDFVERVYLSWVSTHRRPSTANGYRLIWSRYLQPLAARMWLKDVQTFHAQSWLDEIGRQDHPLAEDNLSRNTLKHIQTVLSGLFTVARQLGYFHAANPVSGTRVNPQAKDGEETYAYDLREIELILSVLPELAATIVATAAFSGLRHGELKGLKWPDYVNGEMNVRRSIWRAHVTDPKSRKARAAFPVIRQLADRLEMYRLRTGNPDSGPIFRNSQGTPLSLNALARRVIVPALNRCEICKKSEQAHRGKAVRKMEAHVYRRDPSLPNGTDGMLFGADWVRICTPWESRTRSFSAFSGMPTYRPLWPTTSSRPTKRSRRRWQSSKRAFWKRTRAYRTVMGQ